MKAATRDAPSPSWPLFTHSLLRRTFFLLPPIASSANRDRVDREKFGYALPVPRPPKPPGFDWAAPARPRVGLVRAGIARVRVRGSGYLREGLKD
jgi:hypothetical protein